MISPEPWNSELRKNSCVLLRCNSLNFTSRYWAPSPVSIHWKSLLANTGRPRRQLLQRFAWTLRQVGKVTLSKGENDQNGNRRSTSYSNHDANLHVNLCDVKKFGYMYTQCKMFYSRHFVKSNLTKGKLRTNFRPRVWALLVLSVGDNSQGKKEAKNDLLRETTFKSFTIA